ncbi:MAG: ATP-binding protein [Sterolibacteriaceae bacterium MAG5]|nr:ATP-binding protein [Candidatus Nitricoxidireducens bremensis]
MMLGRGTLGTAAERFEVIFDAIGEAIFLHDDSGRIVEINDAAARMYGLAEDELDRVDIGQLSAGVPPYTQADAIALVAAARAGHPQDFEWHARRRNGELFWVRVRLSAMSIGGRTYLLAVVDDIGERKRFQEAVDANMRDLVALNTKLENAHVQLLQSEKMASIGQLAAGVAHEINNPVGYVYSNLGSLENYLRDFLAMLDAYEKAEPAMDAEARAAVQALRRELDIDYLRQDVATLLSETREGVNRVRKIVQDLKDFSHAGSGEEWRWADLHAGLESTLNIVANELKYKTTVVREYGELPQIYCLPSQINQVFMNLLVNAAHAIETRGVVTVRTGTAGREVWVEVEDTGCGIPPDHLKRIFDPFFTTKPVGKGTGLGLAVSYSIVEKHRGRIEVRSEVGKGTAFRVWLPIEAPAETGSAA